MDKPLALRNQFKIFSFWVPHPIPEPIGVKFGIELMFGQLLHSKFYPIGATCPLRANNVKIAPGKPKYWHMHCAHPASNNTVNVNNN